MLQQAPDLSDNLTATAIIVPPEESGKKQASTAGPVGSAPAAGRWSRGVDWPVFLWITAIHLGALATPWFFTWAGLISTIVLGWVTGSLGICLGYHRLLTHGSFQTYRPVRWFLAVLGCLAGEGPPIHWIAHHRKHHQFSDLPGDPHSPKDGAWWSHVLWLFPQQHNADFQAMLRRYAPDLLKDPVMRFLSVSFLFWHFASGAALLAAGWLIWDLQTGLSLLFFGVFLRLAYVLHATWFVNSASHMWGYRNYETTDNSRNLWWVAIVAYGEGWHNNHHAFQRSAQHGHRWWEFDMTYWVILVLERVGLAWDVVRMKSKPAK
jgi:fatty-acid desaturase